MADVLPLRFVPLEPPADSDAPLVGDAHYLKKLLGNVGLRTIRTWDAAGKLPAPLRIGRRVVWLLDGPWGIRSWLAAGAPDRETWEAMKAASRK